jgi:tetratricopeptide (TPR) repeat protein
VEPRNVELHARLAPLLAATGHRLDAWISFRTCAETAAAEKRLDQAAAVYREATRCLPRELAAWERLAETERQRGRQKEALEALLEARQHFRKRKHRAEAIFLLRCARDIEPSNPEVVLDLASLLARRAQESEAQLLLERLATETTGVELRRVRRAQWRISPTLVNSWRWFRASTGSDAGNEGHIHA